MSAPVVDVDVDLSLLIAEADAVPCMVDTCASEADWMAVLSCGHDACACDGHRTFIENAIANFYDLYCSNAGHVERLKVEITRWAKL